MKVKPNSSTGWPAYLSQSLYHRPVGPHLLVESIGMITVGREPQRARAARRKAAAVLDEGGLLHQQHGQALLADKLLQDLHQHLALQGGGLLSSTIRDGEPVVPDEVSTLNTSLCGTLCHWASLNSRAAR